MTDPLTLTAVQLLAISAPEGLFPADDEGAQRLYRKLALRWHPDRTTGDSTVFAHVGKLYKQREAALKAGRWEGSATIRVTARGREYALHQLASAPFELGQSIVTAHTATYLIDPPHVALARRALRAKDKFRFSSDRMKDEFARYLPMTMEAVDLDDGRLMVQALKTPDCLRLRDVVTHVGQLDARHIAWVVSSLMNLSCYLSHMKIVHHDISPDTYFISPPHHSGMLLGGWWYWAESGDRLTVLPKRTYDVMPFRARTKKIASRQTDLELVRKTALECLTDGPEAMRRWLETPGSGDAVQQYHEWMEVIAPRKFVKLDVTAEQVYGKAVTVHG